MPIEVARPRAAPSPAATPEPDPATAADVDLSVDLERGLVLRNPLIGASGPFGYGVEVADLLELERIGALVTRTTTLRPSSGGSSVRPRIVDVPGGIVSGVGLHNPGIDAVLERFAP
ncbi:MAG: hypothetical protein L0221_06680, partial [Chloroflexi bacterium]|nr:hypothetical protein [Chloroflexota bacterium]